MSAIAAAKLEAIHVKARKKIFGAPIDWTKVFTHPAPKPASKSGRTKIVNARKQFDAKFRGALRALGLHVKTMRASVWIEGDEAHFFDLTLEKDAARFDRFKRDVLARRNRK